MTAIFVALAVVNTISFALGFAEWRRYRIDLKARRELRDAEWR
jgi:hypothetical protein